MTVSIPLPHPESLVSLAWFIEANYYNVDNATYFEPLFGDIGDVSNFVAASHSLYYTSYLIRKFFGYVAILWVKEFLFILCLKSACSSPHLISSSNVLLGAMVHVRD